MADVPLQVKITDILDLPTAELDDTLVLAPDGAGGIEARPEAGSSLPVFTGCKAYSAVTQSLSDATTTVLLLELDEYDTDAFHFTSAANLTGTVAKTATSPNIVGTGTSFTTELSVNQVISIPGTAVEIGVVKAITDNTHLELWQTMANNATGQTATRRNEFMAIPAGKGGKYHVNALLKLAPGALPVVAQHWISKNAASNGYVRGGYASWVPSAAEQILAVVSVDLALAEGDYLSSVGYQDSSGARNIGDVSFLPYQTMLSIALIGT